MRKLILFFIIAILVSCSKNNKLLNNDDLRESTEYITGMWSYYEKDWDLDHFLFVSLPNENGDRVFYYFTQRVDSEERLTQYKGVINPNSFKHTRKKGKSVIELNPIRNLKGAEYIGFTFYINNSSNYHPGYQLRTNTLDMFSKGFSKDLVENSYEYFFEFDYLLGLEF